MYLSRSAPLESAVEDGGRVEGKALYVYGSVVAVGSDMNGDTVRGICARYGWGPGEEGLDHQTQTRFVIRESLGVSAMP